ncbi:Fc.00g110290.m01.CDS01 [Cosmosporella sp. VM-42]
MAQPLISSVSSDYYSVKEGARKAFANLLERCCPQLPEGYVHRVNHVDFITFHHTANFPVFPCPLKEQEAVVAVRALEGVAVAALADVHSPLRQRRISVDVSKAALSLMSAYVTTLDGLGKGDSRIRERIPDTDVHQAQSVMYRRLSANLYETKIPGEYYHIHGSLDANRTLHMLGLETFRPDLQEYRQCLKVIGNAVRQFDTAELESMNAQEKQAGAPALTQSQFQETPHGVAIRGLPPFTVDPLETSTPATGLHEYEAADGQRRVLEGILVLELCRILAGPVIGRSLAAYGASVLKVTCKTLPDVPFFQLDVNTGKRTTSLDLKKRLDRAIFEDLLYSADIIADGYRPGALRGLGYGPKDIAQMAERRGRGIVYVAEDCFGGSGLSSQGDSEWAQRPGWQQIADCVTGLAWEQGKFMGLKEPVVPPFPMSDYGTGALGCVATLVGLYRRATEGGSWFCKTSLCQYDLFVLSLGPYDTPVQEQLRKHHDAGFFDLRHDDSVDEVSQRALKSMKRVHPWLFGQEMFVSKQSQPFRGLVTMPREALAVQGVNNTYMRAGRPNGFDPPSWENWDTDPDYI